MDRAPEDRRRERAREELRGELREAVGPQAAERAERHGALDRAIDARRPHTILAAFHQSRALIAIMLFVALVAGAAIALVSGVWWIVFVALALHAVGTIVVVLTTFSMTSQVESPDPRTAAALEEHGVSDPEGALNEAVRVAAETSGDERARQVRDEQRSITPSHESRPARTPRPSEDDERGAA